MKRPGFSISTFLLVAILLGAVAYVGSLVNPIKPPDKDHDHESEQSQTVSNGQPTGTPKEIGSDPMAKSVSPDRKKFIEDEAKQRRQMMSKIAQQAKMQTGGGKTASNTPMKDPEAIEPTSDIFFKSEMGAEGIQKQEAEVSQKKKEFEAAKAREKKSPYGIAISPDGAKGAGRVE